MKTILSGIALALTVTQSATAVTTVNTLAELEALDYGTEFEFVGKANVLADAYYITTLLTDEAGTTIPVYGAGGRQPGLVINGFTGETPGEQPITGFPGNMIRINKGSIVTSGVIETITPIIAEPNEGFGSPNYALVEYGPITVTENTEEPENFYDATLENGSTCMVSKWNFPEGLGRYESITGVYLGGIVVPYWRSFAVYSVGPKLAESDPNGVESLTTDATDAGVVYYNLQGKRVDNPGGQQLLIEVKGNGSVRKVVK